MVSLSHCHLILELQQNAQGCCKPGMIWLTWQTIGLAGDPDRVARSTVMKALAGEVPPLSRRRTVERLVLLTVKRSHTVAFLLGPNPHDQREEDC